MRYRDDGEEGHGYKFKHQGLPLLVPVMIIRRIRGIYRYLGVLDGFHRHIMPR